jgi:hypothetical protein
VILTASAKRGGKEGQCPIREYERIFKMKKENFLEENTS